MWANNETGVIFPVEQMAAMAKERGILFHTDAVQAVGKIPINLAASNIDFLSLSGHKLHAPKGIGVLYVRKGTPYVPFLVGGHQEKGRRGGTENVASIIGLGKACELAADRMAEENSRVKALRDRLEEGLLKTISHSMLNGHKTERLPNTTSVSFEFVEGESILLHLDRYNICASSGSACTSGSLEPSHVLRAMGVPFTAAHGSIRFSLSVYNTEEEVDVVLANLPDIIANLREMSPFWQSTHKGAVGGAQLPLRMPLRVNAHRHRILPLIGAPGIVDYSRAPRSHQSPAPVNVYRLAQNKENHRLRVLGITIVNN